MQKQIMSQKKFDELAKVHQAHCVSIYMPTHRVSNEGYEEDRIRFKDLLKGVKRELTQTYGLKEDEADQYLQEGYEILEDRMFWTYMGEGMAFFLSPERTEVYPLPITVDTYYHVSDNFYLHPLFPLFNGDGRFYVIAASEKMVKLWEGSRFKIREVALPEGFPTNLQEVVGKDYEDKNLQERSFRAGSGQTVTHGHVEGKEGEKAELERFFQEVDGRLSDLLHDEEIPLVFAGVEYYYGLYKKVAHYRQLEDEGFIKGSPEQMDLETIHSKAWDLVKQRFDEDREGAIQRYCDHMGSEKAVYDNADLVRAAVEGRVDTLFIEKGTHIYGRYNSEDQQVRFADDKAPDNDDLVETAAMNTYRKGGRVFLLDSERMPEPGTQLNALLRY